MTANWPLPDGRLSPTDKVTGTDEAMIADIRTRDAALRTLGNLTLITVSGNSTASNAAFAAKKPWLGKSLLALNLEVLEADRWDLEEIATRADKLADRAVEIWPAPKVVVPASASMHL